MIRPTRALIDRAALRHNLRLLQGKLSPGTRMMCVVKANCYGHSAEICIPEMEAEGIDLFGVATVEEGAQLRSLGVSGRIVVLPPPVPGQYGEYSNHQLEAVVSSASQADQLNHAAGAAGSSIPVHLYIDTGMTRNGVASGEALDLLRHIATLSAISTVGFCSHFATSDEAGSTYARRQLEVFTATLQSAVSAGFQFQDIHLANSGGLLNFPDSHFNVVRPGISLYGYHPTPDLQMQSGLQPVLSWKSVIAGIARVKEGVSVSYGCRYHTACDTTIVTLPVGYADGLMRSLTGRMNVIIRGNSLPVAGTICMDEVMVDILSGECAIGDDVTILGTSGRETITAWDMALQAGTIPYEVCTNISARVPRVAT